MSEWVGGEKKKEEERKGTAWVRAGEGRTVRQ